MKDYRFGTKWLWILTVMYFALFMGYDHIGEGLSAKIVLAISSIFYVGLIITDILKSYIDTKFETLYSKLDKAKTLENKSL